MLLILTLLCKNEVDIISYTIEYHLANGVDLIIATDNHSTDGTRDILSSYQNQGKLLLIDEQGNNHDQSVWVTKMARIAQSRYSADWVIHSDADEFWMPCYESLKQVLGEVPENTHVVMPKRHNFLPPLDEELRKDQPFYQRQFVRYFQSLNSLGNPLPGKVIHRPCSNVRISDGNHAVFSGKKQLPSIAIDSIEILHFPYRSYEQFEKKIVEGTEALQRNTRIKKEVGITWRTIYSEWYLRGSLKQYYESLIPTHQDLAQALERKELVNDFRLFNHFTDHSRVS